MTDQQKENQPKKRRGFAAMSPEKQRDIAARGGKSAHAQGKAHRFTKDEAVAAGSKGGRIASENRRLAREGTKKTETV